MQFNEYQKEVLREEELMDSVYLAMALTVDAGEALNVMTEFIKEGDGIELPEGVKLGLIKKLGDVLKYIAALSDTLDYTLEEVAKINLNNEE